MMSKIHRVVVPIDSHDPKAWQTALAYADKICGAGGADVRNVVLLIHTKAQLNHTDLSRFIGTAQSKRLDKGEMLSMPSGARLRCETLRTVGTMLPPKTVVIAYWADMGLLDTADGLRNLAGIVAVPEFSDNAKAWEDRWGPIVHGQTGTASAKALIDDPVVEKALTELDRMINRSTGLGHPRDKEQAKTILRIRRNKGHRAQPTSIKSWAIRNGWDSDDAGELADLAAKAFAMKIRPSLGAIYGAEERYARWAA